LDRGSWREEGGIKRENFITGLRGANAGWEEKFSREKRERSAIPSGKIGE